MKTNIFTDISPPMSYLPKFWLLSYRPKRCWPIKLQDSLKCNISRKKWMMNFFMACRWTSKFSTRWYYHFECGWPGMPKVPKISLHVFTISPEKRREWGWIFTCRQTQKFSTSWLYHFGCAKPGMPKLPKITSLQYLCNISRKTWKMKMICCQQINIKVSSTWYYCFR